MMPDDTVSMPRIGGPEPHRGAEDNAEVPDRDDDAATGDPGDDATREFARSDFDAVDRALTEAPEDEDSDALADPAEVGLKGHRRKRSRWLTVVTIVGVLVLVCSGTVVALAFGLIHRYESKVAREDILGDLPKASVPLGTDTAPMNFLVLGSDSRAAADADINDPDGSRSDTIMVVHINAAHNGAFIFSIPRDSYVNVPAGGNWKGGLNKINAAFAFGGAKLAAKTVYDLTKIPLDTAMIVNFGGIHRMIEAVGSVNVCIPYTVSSIHTGRVWTAGCHDMGPDETEDFMRQRKSVPGGDFGRIHDQQLVVMALAQKIASEGLLTNPIQLDSLISTAAESLTVDKSTNLRDLILALKNIRPANLTFATVPYTGTFTTPAGSSVKLDVDGCNTLFQAVLDDKTDAWLATHPQQKLTDS